MSTLTTAWAFVDTVVGCTDISQSCGFGVVMAKLGKGDTFKRLSTSLGSKKSLNFLSICRSQSVTGSGFIFHHSGVLSVFFFSGAVVLSSE